MYKEHWTAVFWSILWETVNEDSHEELGPTAAGRHLFDVNFRASGDVVKKKKVLQWDTHTERASERATKTESFLHWAHHGSAAGWWAHISTNRYSLRAAETGRCTAALSDPTALASLDHMHIKHTLDVSHASTSTSIWFPVEYVGSCLSDAQLVTQTLPHTQDCENVIGHFLVCSPD